MRSGAIQCATGATSGMIFRQRYDEVGFPCRKSTVGKWGFPASRWAMMESKTASLVSVTSASAVIFLLHFFEYRFENDFLKTLQSSPPVFDLHAQNCAFPRGQQKLR